MTYDVIVVGGGVAGLFAALRLGEKNLKVLLLEKNKQAGKKLLITGAGQCNITQAKNIEEFAENYGDNFKYIRPSLYNFDNEDVMNFFKKNKLNLDILENGKVFPNSKSALEVRNLLVDLCKKNNVRIVYNEPVQDIIKDKNSYTIVSEKNKYICSHLVLATGGKSYPKTGSTGDGYFLAEKLNQPLVRLRPGLTPVEVEDFKLKGLSGISFAGLPLEIWREGKKLKDIRGDLLITHKGLSGPLILNNSRWMKKGDILKVNFLKTLSSKDVEKQIIDYTNESGHLQIQTIFRDYDIPKRLLETILENLNIDKTSQCSQINRENRKLIADNLTGYSFEIKKLTGYHMAMVTVGGVDMKRINPTSMESRINKNLYFIGELVDIDGDTGGYNIQAALSMAETCKNSILTDFDLL